MSDIDEATASDNTEWYLNCQEGGADKFYHVTVEGKDVITRYGRTGTEGQSQTKNYKSESEALVGAKAQVQLKIQKGYYEAENPDAEEESGAWDVAEDDEDAEGAEDVEDGENGDEGDEEETVHEGTIEERKVRMKAKLATLTKVFWKPTTSPGDGDVTNCKFNGTPYCPKGVSIPECSECNVPMPCIIQLNYAEFPAQMQKIVGDKGMIQLFYCTTGNCDGGCDAFSDRNIRRWYPDVPPKTEKPAKVDSKKKRSMDDEDDEEEGDFEPSPQLITGWKLVKNDKPSRDDLGDGFDEDAYEALQEGEDDEGGGEIDNKLGGWPQWYQFGDWLDCPKCNERMEFIFQTNGQEDTLGFDLSGTGYLMQCLKHRDQVSFSWQC